MARVPAKKEQIAITAPDFREVILNLSSTAPYVQLRFGQKAKAIMMAKMADPASKKRGQAREARDFEEDFRNSYYVTPEGGYGIPVTALKNALLDAATLTGITKTAIKKTIFIKAETIDALDGTPLVSIEGDGPNPVTHHTRNADGSADIRVRAMWKKWQARVSVVYDASILRLSDVVNLFYRAGLQVGIGEGRPASKNSAGMNWGTFSIASTAEESQEAEEVV